MCLGRPNIFIGADEAAGRPAAAKGAPWPPRNSVQTLGRA